MMASSYNELTMKAIEKLLSNDEVDLSKLGDFIAEHSDVSELFKRFERETGTTILHRILENCGSLPDRQPAIIAFMKRFAKQIDLNVKGPDGNTILHVLAMRGLVSVIREMVASGPSFASMPDYTIRNASGMTPLDVSEEENKLLFMQTQQMDFARHVVLVHPLQSNSILNCLFETGKEHLAVYNNETQNYDSALSAVNAVVHDDMMLTNGAVIGAHLDFQQQQYTDSFTDRPHIHWWWNGLFQGNSGGDWENSLIAYLEPLTQFDHVLGCAYYDTMTVGPHQLSAESCIIVPESSVEALRARLKDYQGKIIGFDPGKECLRVVINRVIEKIYPQAFKLVSSSGVDINERPLSDGDQNFFDELCSDLGYDRRAGYFNQVLIAASAGEAIPLIRGSSELMYPAYVKYAQGRFVGLHSAAPTDNEYDPRIKLLMKVSRNPGLIKAEQNQSGFIGKTGTRRADQLCIVKAGEIYGKLIGLHPATGAHQYAEYLMKKALIADFRSLHLSYSGVSALKENDLKRMVENHFSQLLSCVQSLCQSGSGSAVMEYRKAILSIYNLCMRPDAVTEHVDYSSASSSSTAMQPVPRDADARASQASCGFWNQHKNKLIALGVGLGVAAVAAGAVIYSRSKNL